MLHLCDGASKVLDEFSICPIEHLRDLDPLGDPTLGVQLGKPSALIQHVFKEI